MELRAMKTREQAEARARELFPKVPIYSQHYVTNQVGRKAFLKCWEEMQKERKNTSDHRTTSLRAIDEFLDSQQGREYISEMQQEKVEPKREEK